LTTKVTNRLQVLDEIEKELHIFKEDGKTVKYSHSDMRDLINRIAFVAQNNRCKHCKKLITYGDFQNFECGECGFSLSETLGNSGQ